MNDLLSVVSVDVIALAYDETTRQVRVAVPAREREPFLGEAALPGVVVRSGERLVEAAGRALSKFTDASPLAVGQLRTFDEPLRDPRGPSLSIAMYAVLSALDESVSVPAREVPDLAFDHNHIVQEGFRILGERLWQDLGFTRALLPEAFTTRDARAIVTELTGEYPHLGNLTRTLDSLGAVKRGTTAAGRGRPAYVRSIGG